MRVLAADMNRDIVADEPVAGVMAHHALHHFVELEKIFAGIVNVLHAEGTFVTVDVVGRNGHMRWPETLRVIHEIWKLLPDRYRWDHIFQRYDRWYENLDCSTEGFEGIRAQDILPLLAQSFNFEYFYANYGLVDVFIEKRFAANFSPERPVDSLFLDFLQELEEKLIEEGKIKPIQIFAVMRSLSSKTCPAQPRLYKNLSPKFAIREPRLDPTDTTRLSDFTPEFAFDEPQVLPEIAEIPTGTTVPINDSSFGERLLRWGWFPPEGPFTWTSGHDSAIEFQTRDDFKRIELEILPCSIISKERRSLFVSINGVFAKQVGLSSSRWQKFELVPPGGFRARGRVLLEFYDSRPRQPDIDEGPDRRQLGFALASITLR